MLSLALHRAGVVKKTQEHNIELTQRINVLLIEDQA